MLQKLQVINIKKGSEAGVKIYSVLRYALMGVEYMVKNNRKTLRKILWAAVIGSIISVILFHYGMLSAAHSSNLSVHLSNGSKVAPPSSLSHGSNPNMFPLFG
ncbi:MAG TPA: hypothetical protein ENH28_01740 [Euryarchaeota archaeon]|nr:hypothetical protein BMS3Bbin15_00263 [archaeon BMS3Bbin15]HDL14874.1 hypothetical protein [Euryarchaeota archaeon]